MATKERGMSSIRGRGSKIPKILRTSFMYGPLNQILCEALSIQTCPIASSCIPYPCSLDIAPLLTHSSCRRSLRGKLSRRRRSLGQRASRPQRPPRTDPTSDRSNSQSDFDSFKVGAGAERGRWIVAIGSAIVSSGSW